MCGGGERRAGSHEKGLSLYHCDHCDVPPPYEVVLRYIAGQINSMQLTLCRFSVGFLILLPPGSADPGSAGESAWTAGAWPVSALLGLLGIALSMPIPPPVGAVRRVLCGRGAVQLQPGICHLLAFFLLKEPIKPRHISALALEIAGTVAIIDPLGHALNPLGVGLALLSHPAVLLLYGVLGKRRVAEYGGAVVTCFQLPVRQPDRSGADPALPCPGGGPGDDSRRSGGVRPHPHPGGGTPWKTCPTSCMCPWGWRGSASAATSSPWSSSPPAWSPWSTFQACAGPGAGLAAPRRGDPANMMAGILLIVAGSLCTIVPWLLDARRKQRA